MMSKQYDIFGMGNALVDKEFEVSDAFLAEQGIAKGVMSLVDEAAQSQLLVRLKSEFGLKKRASGGSAANTVVAAAQLGARAFYACKVANDEAGEFYKHDLHTAGVTTDLDAVRAHVAADTDTTTATGKCVVMVTPDAERTMLTHLGITADFSVNELPVDALLASHYLYIEGYLVTSEVSRQAVNHARALSQAHGVKTALTFSDPSMVRYFREGMVQMLGTGVDILFCNEEELLTFTQENDFETALAALKSFAHTLVVTRGARGALIVDDLGVNGRTVIEPYPVQAVDSNGAGDMFAGAFMYGLTQGMSNADAGQLASRTAAKIVTVFGARLSPSQYAEVLADIEKAGSVTSR